MTIEEYKELMKKDVLKIGLDVDENEIDEFIDLASDALNVLKEVT